MIAPGNPARGLDAHQGAVLLHDGETGELRAILNASPITEIRTAAVSAVATRALARPDARVVAILGGGVQARSHTEAMRAVVPRRRDPHAGAAATAARPRRCCVRPTSSAPARAPASRSCSGTGWRRGTHVNAVGASIPTVRELDTETMAASSLFVDRRESAVNEAGDLLLAGLGEEHIRAEVGEVLIGAHPGRASSDELTVFKSLGLAVEDLAAAELIVRKAREQGHRHRGGVLIPFAEIERARETIAGAAIRTPLLRLPVDGPAEIWLKLENLQPIGSFKIRGAVNAIRQAPHAATAKGVVTASAGNMAQGVAWAARELGVPATIIVPENAPQTKLDAIARLGGTAVKVPYDRWWEVIVTSQADEAEGLFVHPVQDERVMAGNGTIGIELAEELPDADAVLVPWGGGGLFTGIASALAALGPELPVYAVQPETGAAVSAALEAGEPHDAAGFRPSFVDGAGAKVVLPAMWERARPLLAGAYTVTLDETAAAVRLLAERARVIAEGAGALALAAALSGRVPGRKLVCIVSGGNIDAARLATILGRRDARLAASLAQQREHEPDDGEQPRRQAGQDGGERILEEQVGDEEDDRGHRDRQEDRCRRSRRRSRA